jgi:hypothetical protein
LAGLIGLALLALLPPPAGAGVRQQLIVEDEHRLLEYGRAAQQHALDEIAALGVDKIRTVVWWRFMLEDPLRQTLPVADAGDPRSALYDPQSWAMLDSLVVEARRRGIGLILNPASASGVHGSHLHLPAWAVKRSGAPGPARFAKFVGALGRRYSGGFRPGPGRGPLPEVREWSIWNEPNARLFLRPQWRRIGDRTIPWSPVIYRDLYRRSARALRRTARSPRRIYFGETASMGSAEAAPAASMAPGLFLRELTCVDSGLRPRRGAASRIRRCDRYRRLDTDGLATHFYSGGQGTVSSLLFDPREDVWTPADPGRPVRLVQALGARGRLPRDLPVLNTEAGFQSHPIKRPILGAEAQAFELNMAEYLQWRTPGVASFAQYLLNDDLFWFSGLRYLDGTPKPAYAAFRMPIVVRQAPGGNVRVWGASLGRRAGRPVEIWRDGLPTLITVRPDNPQGYFEVTVPEGRPGARFQLSDGLLGARSRAMSALPAGTVPD